MVSEETRIKIELLNAINAYLGDKGSAKIDVYGKLTVEIVKGFDRVVETVDPPTHNGVMICGGGVKQSINGLKFEIIVKKEGE